MRLGISYTEFHPGSWVYRSIAGDHHSSLGTYDPEQEVLCSPSFSISFQVRLWGRSTIESGGEDLGIFFLKSGEVEGW